MLEERIFNIGSTQNFEMLALEVFQYQYKHESTYRNFCDLLHIQPNSVQKVSDIPFLPIEFFKQRVILSSEKKTAITFHSSGTTGSVTSRHHVADLALYQRSFHTAFTHFCGEPQEFTILALLPSYLEQGGSSLVYMVDQLITESKSPHSGFYLNNRDALVKKLRFLESEDKKVLLLGVSYALLDLIENETFQLKNTLIMETGGMKGRRKELIKDELHQHLKQGFGVTSIHSEYGMTELLSQAYSRGNGIFKCPPWMRVCTRDPEDPLTLFTGKTGGLNVIDLANLYSCSFIATQDLAKIHPDQSFEILGRFDTSDIRGCNLMVL
jgi:phenylacetate-coenzyme A ligase PaaK-like adenylate-forming protein